MVVLRHWQAAGERLASGWRAAGEQRAAGEKPAVAIRGERLASSWQAAGERLVSGWRAAGEQTAVGEQTAASERQHAAKHPPSPPFAIIHSHHKEKDPTY